MKILIAAALCAALAACALPTSNVSVGGKRPTLQLTGAAGTAHLFLDGQDMGLAADFDGVKRVVAIEEGAHLVELRQGTTVLLSQRVFASSGETVRIDAGGAR